MFLKDIEQILLNFTYNYNKIKKINKFSQNIRVIFKYDFDLIL